MRIKHGRYGTKAYIAFKSMKARCGSKGVDSYARYGGRGIRCLWDTFEDFYRDMGDPPTPEHSIDRIDNDGDYCKGNCRWATRIEQGSHRSVSKYVTWNNKTKIIREWERTLGIRIGTLQHRLHLGWTVERTMTQPVRPRMR